MLKLNQRYINDAVYEANEIKAEGVIFGGRSNWKKLLSGLITNSEWKEIRDSQVYSRGDRSKDGNPNLRVIRVKDEYQLRVTLPGGRNFTHYKLYIPEKFQDLFDLYDECYDVRIIHESGKFHVHIGFEVPEVKPVHLCSNGVYGVDTNPNGLGVVDLSPDGNLLGHQYLLDEKLQYASHNKRKNAIEALAIRLVDAAVEAKKGIVLEDLKFSQGKNGFKKFNRMRYNFIYRQLLLAIERRAIKMGVEVRKVNPAFTSIVGILKYQQQYSLNRHTAAALIIGRRGLGIMEKIRVRLESLKNKKLNLEGKGFAFALTMKAYSYFCHLYRVIEVKAPPLTGASLSPPLVGNYGSG